MPLPVRTYLDPDAVGPLPRSALADDSDALAAARTLLRLPSDASTQEIRADDVIDVFDPNAPRLSIAPSSYDTAELLLPRRRLGRYVVGAVAICGLVLIAAAVRTMGASPDADRALATPTATPTPTPTSTSTSTSTPTSTPTSTSTSTSTSTDAAAATGTLRVAASAEGPRVVFVDGIRLGASAAILRCGRHEVAVGSRARTRMIDVPCGGEVTVFR